MYGDADAPLTYTIFNLVEGDTLNGELIRESGKDWKEEGYIRYFKAPLPTRIIPTI